ncbi:MAG: TrmH family RNA methyltransferase [Acidimicrobiia bacterium]
MEAARLHRGRHRKERGLTLIEGSKLLADVLAAGANVVEVFAIDPVDDDRAIPVDRRALARLAGTESPQGPVAVVEIPDERLDRGRNLLVSVGVSDPGNVGTMIRTAAAFGWGFGYTKGSADPWAPKTVRSGAGGQFQTPIARVDSLDDLHDWTTVAAVVHDGMAAEQITQRPVALLIGEEAHGLPADVISAVDQRLTIATPGSTESLNTAVAAGIAVYALCEGSGQPGPDV